MKIDKDKFISLLDKKWVGPEECPVCKKKEWGVLDNIIETRDFQPHTDEARKLYPFAALLCTNCGHTLFFHALIMGLLDIPTKIEG